MSILKLIIKREFVAKVRNKSFIVMTFLSPLLFVGVALFVGYLSTMKAETKKIAIHDESGMFADTFKSDEEYHYIGATTVAMQTLRDSVRQERYEGVLFIPKTADNKTLQSKIEYVSNDSPSVIFISGLQDIIGGKLTKNNFEKAGLDTIAIKNARANVNIRLEKASGEQSLKGVNELKIILGICFGYLIMMFIIIYGNMVMRSVIEEKTNRIVEIIISSVKPFQLMLGKIIGTSLAGILQFLIWIVLGLILMFAATAFFGLDLTQTNGMAASAATVAHQGINLQAYYNELGNMHLGMLLISFIVYFIGGYFLYSSLYAAIGAAVDSETDSQQFMLPIIMPLILGVYIGIATVINDPHGAIATTFSMIPLTSPIVMLMRIPFGVPWWQLTLSMAILFATFFGVVWFAAKIYRVGILMYGKKPTYKELFKWLKY